MEEALASPFLDLGITDPPYVEEYKTRFGHYPTIKLKESASLPTYYMKNGKKRFAMKRFDAGSVFKVTGSSPGKLEPFNIQCKARGSGENLEITIKMIAKWFEYAPGTREESPSPIPEEGEARSQNPPTKIDPALAEKINQRRASAKWSF